jgi:WD40 repeat protein/tRNA A-37 threonylcarbamoyl transferase component Bud32
VAVGTEATLPPPAASNPPAAVTGSEETLAPVAGLTAGHSTSSSLSRDMRRISAAQFGVVDRSRYDVLGEFARGGLGRILRARDPRTGRIVAIKEVLHAHPEITVRFAREALVTANLQHPSIVPVYEVGCWPSGEPFYAMKLVSGRTLDELIRNAPSLSARIALLPHVLDVAEAIAYAHSERVVHRDLKPANVLVGSYGETLVIDWGLAKNLDTGEELAPLAPASESAPGETTMGSVLGTPAYMPPEQARGEPLTERADVYSIGAILYHALSGSPPHADARTVNQVLDRVIAGPPPPLTSQVPEAPPELVAIIDKAMARDPTERYSTAQGLAEDLRRFSNGQLVGAHSYSALQLMRRWIRRNRALVFSSSIALGVLLVLGFVSVVKIAAERDRAQQQRVIAEHERGAAQDARALAEHRLAASFEDLGYQALRAGRPDRALPLLAAALGVADVPAVRRFIAGQAAESFAGLVAVAPGNPAGTTSLALSPDGKRLFMATSSNQVTAWDLGAQSVLWTASDGSALALSPDGELLISADPSGVITARATSSGAERRRWQLPAGPVDDQIIKLAWAPAGDRFALITWYGRVATARLADPALHLLEPHPLRDSADVAYALAFSPSGTRLATAVHDDRVFIHDVAAGTILARLRTPGNPGTSTAGTSAAYQLMRRWTSQCEWLDEDRLLTASRGGMLQIWRVSQRRIERQFDHEAWVVGFVRVSQQRLLVFGEGEFEQAPTAATLWSLESGSLLGRLPHPAKVTHAALMGSTFVTLNSNGRLATWNATTLEPTRAPSTDGTVTAIADGAGLVVIASRRQVQAWRLDAPPPLTAIPGHTARIRDLAFDPTGRTLWTASSDGSARQVDLTSARAPRVLGAASFSEPSIAAPSDAALAAPANPQGLRALAMVSNGQQVITAHENGEVNLWDVTRGTVRATWRGHTAAVRQVIVSRDGSTAFTIGDSTLRRWDVSTGREVARAELGEQGWDIALLAGDAVVASLTSHPDPTKRRVALWDARTLAALPMAPAASQLRELVIADDRLVTASDSALTITSAQGQHLRSAELLRAFVADVDSTVAPRWIAAGGTRGDLTILDWNTMEAVQTWSFGTDLVAALRYRPDGAILAVSGGRQVKIFDPASGRLLAETGELPALIAHLAWSPDGRYLAMAGGSGTLCLWDLRSPRSDEVARLSLCASGWKLDGTTLIAADPDPAACDVLRR